MRLVRKDSQNRPEPKKYSLSFSFSGLVTLVFVSVIGLAWVFILGILVGRGYRPESHVPVFERIMPSPGAPEEPQPPAALIKPEDLQYWENLRSTADSSQSAGKAEAAKVAAAAAAREAALKAAHKAEQKVDQKADKKDQPQAQHPATRGVPASIQEDTVPKKGTKGSKTADDLSREQALKLAGRTQRAFDKEPLPDVSEKEVSQGRPAKPAEPAPKASQKPARPEDRKPDDKKPEDKKGDTGQVYDYVYQVASYNVAEPAKEYQNRLKAKGFKASVEEYKDGNTRWYRINVLFRGRPEDTRELKARLQELGVKKALLRSKKPL